MQNPPRNPHRSEQRLKRREFREKLAKRIKQLEQMMDHYTKSEKESKNFKSSADDPMTEFTTKMMSMDVFRCSSCHNLLKAPIMRIPEYGGNICSECWQTNNWTTGTPNPELELILNELKFPCKFQSTGCKENILSKDLESHESACEYRTKKCFLSGEGCEWQGIQTNFAAHFNDEHTEHVVDSDTNQFDITIPLKSDTDMAKLLRGRKQTFFMKIRNSLISNSISHAVYDVKGSDTASDNQECIIKHQGQTSNSIETKCKIQPLLNSDLTELTGGSQIDLSVLKQLTEAEHAVTLIITINSPNDGRELDEKMLQFFECPVCNNLMKPPIYQCKFGHSFCNVCKPKLEKCPTCRGNLGNSRNYSLEGLTSGIQYTCMYNYLGCEEILDAYDNTHEAQCSYRPCRCPVADCIFVANYAITVLHLKNLHSRKVVTSNCQNAIMKFSTDHLFGFQCIQKKYIIVFDENIFRLNLKRDIFDSFWAVEVLRKHDENAVFIYEIGIIDMKKPERRIIKTDLCLNESKPNALFKKCIVYPHEMISSYVSDGRFNYYCRVYKRN